MAKVQYIDSVNITVARKIVKAMFGSLNILKVEKNDEDWTFEIWLKPDAEVTEDQIKYFHECFGERYIIHRSTTQKSDKKSQFTEQ